MSAKDKENEKKTEKKAETIMRISVKMPDRKGLARLAREFHLDIGGGGPRRLPDGSLQTEAYVPERLLDKMRKAGATIDVIEDATKVGKERQREVGRGDRFEGGKIAPRGLGRKE